jgi:hypothetical protein
MTAPTDVVAGLLEERRGYLVRGLANRVAQVDAELKRLGVEVDDGPEVETADRPVRRSRK